MPDPTPYLLVLFIWGYSNPANPERFPTKAACELARASFTINRAPHKPDGSPAISALCVPEPAQPKRSPVRYIPRGTTFYMIAL